MTKNILALGIMLAGLTATAQTPRLSLFEEFTGETCPPCAATNPGLDLILASPTNTPKVVAIKWQVPIPSVPSPTWSLYKTNKTEIDWRYRSTASAGYGYPSQWTSATASVSGINAAPTGLFDGQHQWVFGAASDHPALVTNAVISTAQSFTSAFSITMTRAWDATYSSVNLTITVQASANFTAQGPLVFRTVMVEKHIQFATQPGTNGEKEFNDVGIASFPTLQGGTAMAGTWLNGQTMTFTLNCPLPSYVRDKSQVAFVGFIQDDGNRKVAQAGRAGVDPLPNDGKAVSAVVPGIQCVGSITPTITISNTGNNAITAATITPYVDVTAHPNFIWTGNLAIGQSTTIILPTINGIAAGAHSFNFNIANVSGTDFNLLNNKTATSFVIQSGPQTTPVAEGFVGAAFPPANWVAYSAPNDPTWIKTNSTGGYGLTTNSTKLDLYTTIPDQSVNNLMLPPYNFTVAQGTLQFDVAYAQWQNSQDKLEVMISSDCGASWSTVYSKAGGLLQTTTGSVNPAFTPGPTQWRTEIIQLTGMQLGNTLVKFVGTSDYGNNLYIDNVNLKQCMVQNLNVTADKITICPGEPITLTATGATSYSWSSGQSTNSIMVTPNSTTTYTAYSADADACSGALASIVVSVSACTGIEAMTSSAGFAVYPNPNTGEFSITTGFTGNTLMTVFNTIGQKVFVQTVSNKETKVKTSLPKGLYHFELTQGSETLGSGKLVIE